MKMLKVMEKRRTVREYDATPLDEAMMRGIQDMIESMPIIAGTEDIGFTVLENGDSVYQALDGIVGYNGLMMEAPHYILVSCPGSNRDYQVVGYLGEWLALSLGKHDIGTCWLSCEGKSDLVKERLGLDMDDEVAAIIAFGSPKEDKKLSKNYEFGETTAALDEKAFSHNNAAIKDENYAYRKAISEIVFLKTFGNKIDTDEIAKRGLEDVFYYMRNAPSWGNLQPWRFILDGERIVLVMEINSELSEEIQAVDAGIAMLYLEVAMHDRGLSGKWNTELDGFKEKLNVPDSFRVIGYYCQ